MSKYSESTKIAVGFTANYAHAMQVLSRRAFKATARRYTSRPPPNTSSLIVMRAVNNALRSAGQERDRSGVYSWISCLRLHLARARTFICGGSADFCECVSVCHAGAPPRHGILAGR